jgi:hypothetical protein
MNRCMKTTLLIAAVYCMAVGSRESIAAEEAAPKIVSMAFGWPFLEPAAMQPRGGTTEGTEVTLAPAPSEAWQALQAPELTPQEKDRRAILALAGDFRVSFQFTETMGFEPQYTPPRPYFSWGTEQVRVLENSERFVSLQHTLVMYFAAPPAGATEDGAAAEAEPAEPQTMLVKHWRQDWSYEDRELHVYRGNSRWQRALLSEPQVAGAWTQAVFQVDDSPRYEVLGRWEHDGGVSRWNSDDAWRPLPRREFAVRKDYNVLAGTHAITITPHGWVHAQDNRKLAVGDKGAEPVCLAIETGINRYERIVAPDVSTPADAYWAQTGAYWSAVRAAWADVFATRDTFLVRKQVDGTRLFEEHFGYAAQFEEGARYDPEAGREHARATIEKFVTESE